MSRNQNNYLKKESSDQEIYMSASSLQITPEGSTTACVLNEVPSYTTAFTALDFDNNNDEVCSDVDETQVSNKKCFSCELHNNNQEDSNLQKSFLSSISDDEVHGSRRKSRRSETSERKAPSSSDNDTASSNDNQQNIPEKKDDKHTSRISRIPRPVTRIQKSFNEVTKPVQIVNDNSYAQDLNISSPDVLEISESFLLEAEQKNNESEPKSLPSLVSNSEIENEKIPKRKPNTPNISPSKLRLSIMTENNSSFWRVSGKKIYNRVQNPPIVPRRQLKPPANLGPGGPEVNQQRPIVRSAKTPLKPSNLRSSNKNNALAKPAEIDRTISPLRYNSHKLASLEARYKIHHKRYTEQNKDLLGLSAQLESTRKNLIKLGEEITTLGGNVPAGDFEKVDTTTKTPIQLTNSTNQTVSAVVDKTDQGTHPSPINEIPPSDFAVKLQEENKTLLAEIKKLQIENADKVSWINKNLQEMKEFEESNEVTSTTCEVALKHQNELNVKLVQCDKAVKELVSLSKDATSYKTTNSKLKIELDEEKLKLEKERKAKLGIELKLNQELATERNKVKAEKAKREAVQTQLNNVSNERNSFYQEKINLGHLLEDLQQRTFFQNNTLESVNEKIHNLQLVVKEKEAMLNKADAIIEDLSQTKEILEQQIVDLDMGSKTVHCSVVEMSKQLLHKDEQLSELKSQRDQAVNENNVLSDLFHFLVSLNGVEMSEINLDVVNDTAVLFEIKEKLKEAIRVPNRTITESLVLEQAEQIKEQALNIQQFREKIDKQNDRIQELISSLSLKEEEIVILKTENNQQSEKLRQMESNDQGDLSVAENNENETKDIGIESGGKVTKNQLLAIVVAKNAALARMESKVNQLEHVHSMCARRRARGESRIAHLESMMEKGWIG